MDGVHDLGGKPGYGKVEVEADEPVFHGRWEATVFAMMQAAAAAGALGNSDRFRHAVERVHPGAYLAHGYYGRWLGAIENLLVEAGLVTQEEIRAKLRQAGHDDEGLIAARPDMNPAPMGEVGQPGTAIRPASSPPKFQLGDRVRTLSAGKPGHTRLPAYARGKEGEIIASHDAWVLPDSNAQGEGENPEHLYTVRFTSEALWQSAGFSVNLDLFESYLTEATTNG